MDLQKSSRDPDGIQGPMTHLHYKFQQSWTIRSKLSEIYTFSTCLPSSILDATRSRFWRLRGLRNPTFSFYRSTKPCTDVFDPQPRYASETMFKMASAETLFLPSLLHWSQRWHSVVNQLANGIVMNRVRSGAIYYQIIHPVHNTKNVNKKFFEKCTVAR